MRPAMAERVQPPRVMVEVTERVREENRWLQRLILGEVSADCPRCTGQLEPLSGRRFRCGRCRALWTVEPE